MPIAVLDLGSNTFNLLVIKVLLNGFEVLVSEKTPVKIGQGSYLTNNLTQTSMQRGINAIKNHLTTISKYQVNTTYCYATSAIRSAKNQKEFVEMVYQNCGIKVHIIDGETEAQLIYNGVKNAVTMPFESLIMDIGGGSTEFLYCKNNQVIHKNSFNIGVSRIKEILSFSDPILPDEIQNLNNYLSQHLTPFFNTLPKKISTIIGSAGTFDSLAEIQKQNFTTQIIIEKPLSFEISKSQFLNLNKILVSKTIEQRQNIKGLLPFRADVIHLGSLIIKFVLDYFKSKKIIQSNYSLKEGVIFGLLNSKNGQNLNN